MRAMHTAATGLADSDGDTVFGLRRSAIQRLAESV
jgi:hypothetical protein